MVTETVSVPVCVVTMVVGTVTVEARVVVTVVAGTVTVDVDVDVVVVAQTCRLCGV